MVRNSHYVDNARKGAAKQRTQFQTPSGLWVKRDVNTGRIIDIKKMGQN